MLTRRESLCHAAALAGLTAAGPALAQSPGDRPPAADSVSVVNPRGRVPVSLIIDDSTCLVNLNRFAIPQFAAGWNYARYHHDWRSMPVEIPDSFVRRFGDWCEEHGVKGKYSIVPYPACVGRLDRELPGWTSRELKDSIRLVRDHITRNWDIHPEMVTHTRVIDIRTGHPYPERSAYFMENWRWTDGKSADEIAAYMRYALRILHNIDLPCEGITTPGGFGGRVLPELAVATMEACRGIYGTEIPHYFRHLYAEGDTSVAPRVEYASGLGTDDPKCVVSIIGCTGDWTGGWDCSREPEPDRFITPDLSRGRLVDVIGRGEPACLVCHWTGIHFNGRELGFQAFQEVVRRLHEKYDHLLWMKNSEIARYWAARELTRLERDATGVNLHAPFACPDFTLRFTAAKNPPVFLAAGARTLLERADSLLRLKAGSYTTDGSMTTVCFHLPKGDCRIETQG
jgi:hypothetical protein